MCALASALFVEQAEQVPDDAVLRGCRIGVRGDERARAAPWRLYLRGNPYVSGYRPPRASGGGVHAAR
jgi:3-methyladenine DNA glycosylase Mpg